MATIRDVFAQNLRCALSGRGSSARLCDRTGISRVQLNRYLKGTLPNEPNLQRIAEYLGVEEHTLFQTGGDIQSRMFSRFVKHAADAAACADRRDAPERVAKLIYFEIPGDDAHVVRSPVLERIEGGVRLFRRFTKFSTGPAACETEAMSVHTGVTSVVGNVEYLSGFNGTKPFEPSMIAVEGDRDGRRFSRGNALVLTLSGPSHLKLLVEHIRVPIVLSEAVALAGVISRRSLRGDITLDRLFDPAGPLELAFAG